MRRTLVPDIAQGIRAHPARLVPDRAQGRVGRCTQVNTGYGTGGACAIRCISTGHRIGTAEGDRARDLIALPFLALICAI
eukprot:329398-Rhodomonas_salina.1